MTGVLVIVSGAAGAGKDFVIDNFLKTEPANKMAFKKIRTHADRQKRDGEPEDAHYFVSKENLDLLQKENKLAEEIVFTGYSRKATSKSEIMQLFENQNLIWRVDPTLASKIAEGNYFEKYFPEHSHLISKASILIHIHSPKEIIEERRKNRDKNKYLPEEYNHRDKYEEPYLQIILSSSKVKVIENLDGQLDVTLNKFTEIITKHYETANSKG